jgi:hypothetical protein
MALGGKRAGAGRKAGTANIKTREIANKAMNEGITPLEYILNILRNENVSPDKRYEAAVDAAPYVHAKLASTTIKNPDNESFRQSLEIYFKGTTK